MSEGQKEVCPVCGAADLRDVLTIPRVPVCCNRLYADREEALRADGDTIALVLCRNCDHCYNLAFREDRLVYSGEYENSLYFSARFREYADSLVARLVKEYDLHNKDLVEIGCGSGEFLASLCQAGPNRGIGFDPGYREPDGTIEESAAMEIHSTAFSEQDSEIPADFVCSRHVLEHLPQPFDLLDLLRKTLARREGVGLYLEVPNAMYTLRDHGIWDLIYEHFSYFTIPSLVRLCTRAGFRVIKIQEAYEGQFISADLVSGEEQGCRPDAPGLPGEQTLVAAEAFAKVYKEKTGYWQTYLNEAATRKESVVVWGAGSKGVTFLNVLNTRNQIEYIVDVNPRKTGKHVPCSGQEVILPETLKSCPPDRVILMNPVYKNEIAAHLEGMGISARVDLA